MSKSTAVLLLSMAARDPDGADAAYLEWHALDHRPELHQVPELRAALRLVSTPECRAARAASDDRYDAVDHVMTYLFAGRDGVAAFGALGADLAGAGKVPLRLPTVELGAYEPAGMAAAPRVVSGAEMLPWRPALGAYLLIERGAAPADDLVEVAGVAGGWWCAGTSVTAGFPADSTGLQLTCCWLDDDPVTTAGRLGEVVAERWSDGRVEPLLAAPFHTVVPFAWDRYLP